MSKPAEVSRRVPGVSEESASGDPLLAVVDLHAYYGKSHILQGVNFEVHAGEIVSLLGRNGVGRSTTIKAIMGDVAPQGSVRFKGSRSQGCARIKSRDGAWAMCPKTGIFSPRSRCARTFCWVRNLA